jgi:hypothetical protein
MGKNEATRGLLNDLAGVVTGVDRISKGAYDRGGATDDRDCQCMFCKRGKLKVTLSRTGVYLYCFSCKMKLSYTAPVNGDDLCSGCDDRDHCSRASSDLSVCPF